MRFSQALNFLLTFFLVFFFSCAKEKPGQTDSDHQEEESTFAQKIEKAHNQPGWNSKKALEFDLKLIFRGEERLNAHIVMETNFKRIKFLTRDSTELYFVDNEAYIFPSDADYQGNPRFDLLTWPYFLTAPFKLSDPGTKMQAEDSLSLDERAYPVSKLSFESGVGDAPDDWYKVFRDPETNYLKALVYIVTYSRSQEKAEENPHAIVYDGFEKVEGIAIPTEWAFYNWREEGLEKKLGEAMLENLRFVEPEDAWFEVPKGAARREK